MILLKSDPNSLHIVSQALLKNSVVIIPTDTVYGFSGLVPHSDSEIRQIKGREETKPFIQLIAHAQDIQKYSDTIIPDTVLKYMPGPLTVIVKNKLDAGTTAFRCPDDMWLQNLLLLCKSPIYSTSTNRSGQAVLSDVSEMEKEFGTEVFCIVDGEFSKKEPAIPSTIVDISNGDIKVIRQGSVYL